MSDEKRVNYAAFHLDLSSSRSPRAFHGDSNLWKDDLRRIYRLVAGQVKLLNPEKGQLDRKQARKVPHLSIAIFGPSGSGKSSLLRTLREDVRRGDDSVLPQSLRSKIASLPVMDPTTWSDSDQFLYAFLAAALETERKELDEDELNYPQGLSPVQLAFQEVNEYLRVVDDPGRPEEHDPLGLSLQRLERHTSGLRLRRALEKFITELARELGNAQILLLPVDDLDMAPDHLVRSLQTYQSFLVHHRLVPVFTFTDRMPEELIEAHYRRSLHEGENKPRRPRDSSRLMISEQLAVQFLARCFPVRNRIRLGPAPARVQRAMFSIAPRTQDGCKESGSDEERVLDLLLTASFLLFGHPDSEDMHNVKASLRPSTLRRQFQVVDAMQESKVIGLMAPQLAVMGSGEENEKALGERLALLATGDKKGEADWQEWSSQARKIHRAKQLWADWTQRLEEPDGDASERRKAAFHYLTKQLCCLRTGATWGSIFNTAAWSLLNVHRDTLRELGLWLEDLYSWSPKELRTVVLDRILSLDSATRRTVIDRWFNRTDYRRSQVLSLLAANIHRPWLEGEEPYGDEAAAVAYQRKLEADKKKGSTSPCIDEGGQEPGSSTRAIDHKWNCDGHDVDHVQTRLTLRTAEGFVWFLNVTMGFYLPQIMALSWEDAFPGDHPVKERMSCNGWDLRHAPVSAVKLAHAKQELASFGMFFLDHAAFGCQLTKEKSSREGLLLRIWSCYGYSRGRFWAAISLWRGLSLIGQTLELALGYRTGSGNELTDSEESELEKKIERLLHSHCMGGLVPGALHDQGLDDKALLRQFPRWEPDQELDDAIKALAKKLLAWLKTIWTDRILPMPVGDVWIGWVDSFVRRVHGENIVGALWPRLNAAYFEEQKSGVGDDHRWTAATAASVWSDLLLEYWRGCPGILRLLLTCPVFLRSERFKRVRLKVEDALLEGSPENVTGGSAKRTLPPGDSWLKRLSLPDAAWDLSNESGLAYREKLNVSEAQPDLSQMPDCFKIKRVNLRDFSTDRPNRHAVVLDATRIDVGKEGVQVRDGKKLKKEQKGVDHQVAICTDPQVCDRGQGDDT